MKYLMSLIYLCTLITTSAFAGTIENVEYQLPRSAKEWEIADQLQNEKGTTEIYVPKGSNKEQVKEFFGVNSNHYQSNVNDTDSIKKGISSMYPGMNIDLWAVEKNKDDLIYEWTAKKNGQEKIHGWGRVFVNNNGSITLAYQTEDVSNIQKTREIWVPVFKSATRISN